MAFVVKHHISTLERSTARQSGRRVAAWFNRRINLTPQERANLYVSGMPIAVITASVGGHPIGSDRKR